MVAQLLEGKITPVIVNNSSNALPQDMGCKVIELGDNLGIAKAQNVGLEFVKRENGYAVIFFDQDSVINQPLLETLLKPIVNGEAEMTAPVFYDEKQGFFYKIISIDAVGRTHKHTLDHISDKFETNVVISSGHTVKLSVFETVGDMADDFFIDYVDTEWCLRAASFGYRTRICKEAIMQHSIGDKVINLGHFKAPVHSPYRRYYRIRNAFLLLRKKHIPKRMACREVIYALLHHMVLICCCTEKMNYIKYLLLGIWHGIRGRSGKL